MSIVCDFHIHSKYSRATSKDMTLPVIGEVAKLKGIDVVATGDFVHPGWLSEIEEQLEELGTGLLKLKNSPINTKFILSTEISSIYKKGDKVRKIHNVIMFPLLEDAKKFSAKLDKIGNIRSDGRPILGLDSKFLLEMALEINDNVIFIPAHIWTPWFSLFGSKSGFDSIEECFEDLTEYIFALETGLSSDPPMNWRWSAIDRFTLVSNSDAHSPANLCREANIIEAEKSFLGIRDALQNKRKVETLEFFPEEGKYHFDGHRKCNVRLTPEEAIALNNKCPVCGKALTMGVYHRIVELADRESVNDSLQRFKSVVPLSEILSQILNVGPKSKKVQKVYNNLIEAFGTELSVLKDADFDSLKNSGGEILSVAIKNMRENKIVVEPGFDGEYGKISVLSEKEKAFYSLKNGLFNLSTTVVKKEKREKTHFKKINRKREEKYVLKYEINNFQQNAVVSSKKLIVIQAGPGTGKTFTLVQKVKYLLEKGVNPNEICVVTFTNKACDELLERIGVKHVKIVTFHKLCIDILKSCSESVNIISPEEQENVLKLLGEKNSKTINFISVLKKNIFAVKHGLEADNEKFEKTEIFKRYENYLEENNLLDFDDIISKTVNVIANGKFNLPFKFLLVDEFQDIDVVQFVLLKEIFSFLKMLFVIGDENQSIYGFRGGSNRFFNDVKHLSENIDNIKLKLCYRSCGNILELSDNILRKKTYLEPVRKCKGEISFLKFKSEEQEAVYIAKEIKKMVGGIDFHTSNANDNMLSFKDFAVLYRVHSVGKTLEKVFAEQGIPYQVSKDTVYSELDNIDLKAEKVKLLSFHASKGLDFKVVFIIGVEEGLVPFDENIDEERRLLYVAVTRAMDKVVFTSVEKRFLYGKNFSRVSPFLKNFEFLNAGRKTNGKGLFF